MIEVNETGASTEMPRYKSHKEIWALKIAAIQINSDRSARIAPKDADYANFNTKLGYADRFKGTNDDLGYYVRYADGYESWSPTKAFEDGYTRV